MSVADVHQILIPYLLASAATALIVLASAALLWRQGAKEKRKVE
jgi:hypothetical protein